MIDAANRNVIDGRVNVLPEYPDEYRTTWRAVLVKSGIVYLGRLQAVRDLAVDDARRLSYVYGALWAGAY